MWSRDLKLDALRIHYDAAASIHRACNAVLAKTRRAGEIPSQGMRNAEARARERFVQAIDKLSAAIDEDIATRFRPLARVT
jgi:hypothetical protein